MASKHVWPHPGERPALSFPQAERTRWGPADIVKAIGLVFLGAIAITVPAAVVASFLAGDGNIEEDAGALTVVLVASLVLELIMLLSVALFGLYKHGASWADLGLRRPQRGGLWLPFILVLIGLALVYVYVALLNLAGAEPESGVPEQAFDNVAPLLLLVVLSLAFAPFMEEIFFRGFVFAGLRGRWGTLRAALASGLLFGLAHLGNTDSLYLVVPISAVGALFALGYAFSDSVLVAILAHFLFNLVSLVAGLAA